MTDRRAFLSGLAGLSLAGTVTAAFPSTIVRPACTDAIVFDLGRDLDAATDRWEADMRAHDDAVDRVTYPEPPAALFYRRGDDEVGVLQPTYFRDGLAWYGDEVGLVARNPPRRARNGPEGQLLGFEPDPDGVARVAEIVAAHRAWQADMARAREDGGVTAADATYKASGKMALHLMSEMTTAPALTLAGVLVKARAVCRTFGDVDCLSVEIGDEPDGTAEHLALSIVRDLLRIAETDGVTA